MKRFFRWLKRLARWFGVVWLVFLISIVALAWSFRPGSTESEIRVWGLILQLVGIWVVIYNVREFVRHWMTQFPRWDEPIPSGTFTSSAVAVAELVASAAKFTGTATFTESPEQQVSEIRADVARMTARLTEMEQKFRDLSDILERRELARLEHDKRFEERLKRAEADALPVTLAAVCLLTVGVILATIAPEIAKWTG